MDGFPNVIVKKPNNLSPAPELHIYILLVDTFRL